MKKFNNKGFTLVEGLLILVLAGIIVGTGWWVSKSRSDTNKPLDNPSNSQTPVKATQNTATGNSNSGATKYLEIKELGIKIPLTATTADAYYNGYHGSGKVKLVNLRVHSLDSESDCKTGEALLAILQTMKKSEIDFNAEGAGSVPKNGTTIGDNYYWVSLAQYGCTQNRSYEKLLGEVRGDLLKESSNIAKL